MLEAKKIRIYIVEDDDIQAEILRDRLADLNKGSIIKAFPNGEELYKELNNGVSKKNYNIIILDYFLQNKHNEKTENADTVVQILREQFTKTSIILYSAYDFDNEIDFKSLNDKNPNIISFVKKSEHGYLGIQNLIRFSYIDWVIKKRRKSLLYAAIIYTAVIVSISTYFIMAIFS